MLNQMITYLEEEKRLTNHQSGNKKLHSTESLNILISDNVLESMDRKQITALVLLDLSNAFDSIDHSLLLTKLRLLGFSNRPGLLSGLKAIYLEEVRLCALALRYLSRTSLYMESPRAPF